MSKKSKTTKKNKSFYSKTTLNTTIPNRPFSYSFSLPSFTPLARVRKLKKPFFLHSPLSPLNPINKYRQMRPKLQFSFQDTKFKNVCYNRRVRKEVLFALKKIGYGAKVRKPRFTEISKIRCV